MNYATGKVARLMHRTRSFRPVWNGLGVHAVVVYRLEVTRRYSGPFKVKGATTFSPESYARHVAEAADAERFAMVNRALSQGGFAFYK
jgi:hypothetical protein